MELDGLRVVHAGLDRAADDLMGIVSRIDARLQRLAQDLQPLRVSWIGDAQHSYIAAQQQWDAAIAEMRDLLREASQQVAQSNYSYRAADARGARAFDI